MDGIRELLVRTSADQRQRLLGLYAVVLGILLTAWPDWTAAAYLGLPGPMRVVVPTVAGMILLILP